MSDEGARAFHQANELGIDPAGHELMSGAEVAELRAALVLADLADAVDLVRDRCALAIDAGIDADQIIASILAQLGVSIPRPLMLAMKGLAMAQAARQTTHEGAAGAADERGS